MLVSDRTASPSTSPTSRPLRWPPRTSGPTMSVADNGPGLPADQRERIFKPFVRVSRSRGGTGLGLAIVRRTVESHGGTITCDPSPIGGARFTLRLPADS
jgi:two-component system, OmpR family, sensor kinase